MLEIKNLAIQYIDKKVVVENFSLSLKKGEIISIVGESGSGKSTVLRSIIGLLSNNGKIISGDILYEGQSLKNKSLKDWLALRGTEITMISQDSGGTLNPIRKIGTQYIEYIQAHSNVSKKEAEEKALSLLEKVKLRNPKNVMESYPHQLSGGMKQRVGIAMALTFNPKIILADEPTSALDVTTQAEIVRELMELREEFDTAMILVTHNIGVAAYMADKIIVMKDGNIVEQGTREEVIEHPKDDYTKKLLNAVPEMGGERFV
ncbi:ABC transporter ATP-binding protein [Fusobacterium gastrosuis]|uniref:ABC transporter ATP-binding protein n=1 Tax=Fusobacterium gastrosuis TaxID=1755100 RepID=UPI0025FD42CA|nr:ABC transporter ATP-binding protein [uncultured Fusobacterium sp.]MDD7409678.1 ABC transporter ATP-binding protein [Fusobacteriaceae bacterium]MDY5713393.1 ABC transporter ATP-binding protein [Fusobacterium gastrosuis]